MTPAPDFLLGVIEGYFGRQWSWQCRRDYAAFLKVQGLETYIYAPKNDAYLRKQWQHLYPDTAFAPLLGLRQHYARAKVAFGIGFSPFELYRDFSAANQDLLLIKLQQLNALQPDIFCILFDDMLGALDNLAQAQLDIVDFITTHANAQRYVVCPTYYSYDPLLVRHFGAAPERYLDELGEQLDPAIALFWTGPKVISSTYPAAHLAEVGERLRRRPLLWDNYPVNDAQRLTAYLHLAPAPREPQLLGTLCAGHLCNPMNQGYLSWLPLQALAQHYQGQPATLASALQTLCSAPLAHLLARDAEIFQHRGLNSLTAAAHEQLLADYTPLVNQPMAQEVVDWLSGAYAFDPDCLT